jgi:hypothetical protein
MASAVFNVGGALLFAFPASLGQLAGLPAAVPGIYRAMLAMFILLFAAAYAWLARQPSIDRPLVALAALGKASAFAVVFVFWLFDGASGLGMIAGTGDLVLAAIFAWWLLGE